MKKLTVKIAKTTEEELIIELPYYSKNTSGTQAYKIFGTETLECINAYSEKYVFGVQISATSNAFNYAEKCTKSDFDAIYEHAMARIIKTDNQE